MKALFSGGLAVTLALPSGLAAVMAGAASSQASSQPSQGAVADIPADLLVAYRQQAANCPGLPWPVLAAIGKVESDHGRTGGRSRGANGDVVPPIIGRALDGTTGTTRVPDTDTGRLDGDSVWERAVGPMQFLPRTWMAWGRDANGDGTADPHNAFDAIAGASAYLCGATARIDDVTGAVLRYNRSSAYLNRVLAVAAGYTSSTTPGSGSPTAAALISHPNIALSEAARADLQSGLVDPRLIAALGVAADRFPIHVGVIRTGHSQCVGGGNRQVRPACSVSEHWYYRGADIGMVAGAKVAHTNRAARALAELLVRLRSPVRPDELGVPWSALAPLPGVFADAAHQDHLHLGYRASRPSF